MEKPRQPRQISDLVIDKTIPYEFSDGASQGNPGLVEQEVFYPYQNPTNSSLSVAWEGLLISENLGQLKKQWEKVVTVKESSEI